VETEGQGFSESDRRASRQWQCCAIGENRERLESLGVKFSEDGHPETASIIHDLGLDFLTAIAEDNTKNAREILGKITSFGT